MRRGLLIGFVVVDVEDGDDDGAKQTFNDVMDRAKL